jgi:hypothetical protein
VDAKDQGSPLSARIRVFDASGTELASDANIADPFLQLPLASGTYYVGIGGAANATYDPSTAGSGTTAEIGPYLLYVGRLVMADVDNDGDVDLGDFAVFQGCFNGPNRPYALSGCADSDYDTDSDVDLTDFAVFQACFNGPNRPPACE